MFGYPITMTTEHRSLSKLEKYSGVLWDILALVFVGNRAVKGSKLVDRWKTVVFEMRKLWARLPRRTQQTIP
jgi:hypothetical protein